MTYRYFILLLLLVWGRTALAQREYQPGYIVKPAGDTLRGLVRYVENHQQALSCCYRPDMKEPVVCYQPIELAGYGFDTGRIYESILFEGEPIFMQVLASGNATLLKHQQQYYVQKGIDPPIKLEARDTLVYRSGKPFLAQIRTYASLLGDQLMADCPAVQPLLNRATLKDVDLIPVFEIYNRCRPTGALVRSTPLAVESKAHVSIGAGLSWNISTLRIVSTSQVPVNAIMHPSQIVIPQPGIWLVINTPRISKRFAFQTGLSFIHENFQYSEKKDMEDTQGKIGTIHQELWLQLNSLRLPLMIRYNLPGSRLASYLSGGVSLLLPVYSESNYTVERERDHDQLVNSYRYPFLTPASITIGTLVATGIKIPIAHNLVGFVEGRYEYSLDGIAKTSSFDTGVFPHAINRTSLAKAPYQAIQVSIGVLFR